MLKKLLDIQIKKVEYRLEVSVDSESSIANLDIAFKDLCIQLRSTEEKNIESISHGQCMISVFETSLQVYEVEKLTKEQLIDRVNFYLNNILKSKKYLHGTPIYRDVEKCYQELDVVSSELNSEMPKQQILSRFGRDIEFFNRHLFYKLLPSHEVEVIQIGFSQEELKGIIKEIYDPIRQNRNFLYNADFENLTVQ